MTTPFSETSGCLLYRNDMWYIIWLVHPSVWSTNPDSYCPQIYYLSLLECVILSFGLVFGYYLCLLEYVLIVPFWALDLCSVFRHSPRTINYTDTAQFCCTLAFRNIMARGVFDVIFLIYKFYVVSKGI